MPAGHVDRNVLSNNYQEPGQIYDDKKTEAAFEVVAQQVDSNWDEYKALKDKLASTTAGDSGAHNVASAPIAGVSGTNVYAQMSDLKNQIIQSAIGEIPDGSIPETKLAFAIATQAELDAALLESRNNSASSKMYAYRNMGGL